MSKLLQYEIYYKWNTSDFETAYTRKKEALACISRLKRSVSSLPGNGAVRYISLSKAGGPELIQWERSVNAGKLGPWHKTEWYDGKI